MSAPDKKPKKRRTRANTRAIAEAVEQLGGIERSTVRKVRQITGGSQGSVQKKLASIRGRMTVEVAAVRSLRSQVQVLQDRLTEVIAWATEVYRLAQDHEFNVPPPPIGLNPEEGCKRPSLPVVILNADDEVAP
jgi:hypothetical protein